VLTNIASVLVGFAMFANLLLTTNDNPWPYLRAWRSAGSLSSP
jgi:hypothetical protein